MQDMTVFRRWCDLAGPKIVSNLESRRFQAYYCKTGAEVADKAMALIPQDHSVSWGGSVTLGEIGLYDKVRAAGLTVIDRDTAKTTEERFDLMRQALSCGTFLTSVNAISEDGVLVNVDGVGNRVAAMTFGPQSVIVIVGMQKVCKTEADALARARNYASPVNATRLALKKTPCAVTGLCGNCKTEECVCSYIIQTRMCKLPGRIKVILVGEPLGY